MQVDCLHGYETLSFYLIFPTSSQKISLANATQQMLSRARIHTIIFSQVW